MTNKQMWRLEALEIFQSVRSPDQEDDANFRELRRLLESFWYKYPEQKVGEGNFTNFMKDVHDLIMRSKPKGGDRSIEGWKKRKRDPGTRDAAHEEEADDGNMDENAEHDEDNQ